MEAVVRTYATSSLNAQQRGGAQSVVISWGLMTPTLGRSIGCIS